MSYVLTAGDFRFHIHNKYVAYFTHRITPVRIQAYYTLNQ